MNVFARLARDPRVQKVAAEVGLLLAREAVRVLTRERPSTS